MTPAATANGSGVPSLRIVWGCVLASAVLLALRKPWALHTPQFWAEDGSIFMTQDDQLGLRAFLVPYNGYLHLLPRLVAWIARHIADVAWWPALYNGFAYATHVALFARFASRRVELPAKPALMLASVLVVGTGEVLLNVTNLQWVAAFFLILQLFTARPVTPAQRVGDLGLLLAVGLNGPFAILLTPLFAWRAWRDRHLDAILAFAVMAACALVQGVLVLRAGASIHAPAVPINALMFCSVIGSRVVTWTLFGPAAVHAAPVWVHAVFGLTIIGAVLAWSLRPAPRQAIRTCLVVPFCLVTAAGAYRLRADTWPVDTLEYGDRYFHIPRVLFVWLLILEWDAAPRAIAWTARALCLLGLFLHGPHFVLPAPPDYQWAAHCDPIRRGVPARIPTLPEGYWIDYTGRPGSP